MNRKKEIIKLGELHHHHVAIIAGMSGRMDCLSDTALAQGNKIANLQSDNKELRMQLEKLQWRMDNPPKYKVGDVTKNRIVTEVEVMTSNQYGITYTGENAVYHYTYYYAYHVTNRSTGKVSVLTD